MVHLANRKWFVMLYFPCASKGEGHPKKLPFSTAIKASKTYFPVSEVSASKVTTILKKFVSKETQIQLWMPPFWNYSRQRDDDRIVSRDAPRLSLYYHCVRDVIIYSTLSWWNHGVLSHLSEFRGFCFQEYCRFSLYSLRFQGEFCRYSEGFYLCFVEVQISCAESICERRRALIPAGVANIRLLTNYLLV